MKIPESGLYIVIEGQDGTGKSTQVAKLAEYLTNQGLEVTTFDEPGGLPSTDAMRAIIKNREFDLDGETQVALFTAARRELWTKKAEPVLGRAGVVLAARNWWSTLAYQHFGQNVARETIETITRELLPKRYVEPDLATILTLNDHERAARMQNRDTAGTADTISEKDTIESKDQSIQDAVNLGYETIARDLGIPLIDANGTPDDVADRIKTLLKL
jgi:dTMP kinase